LKLISKAREILLKARLSTVDHLNKIAFVLLKHDNKRITTFIMMFIVSLVTAKPVAILELFFNKLSIVLLTQVVRPMLMIETDILRQRILAEGEG
jgi:hypothetical protein